MTRASYLLLALTFGALIPGCGTDTSSGDRSGETLNLQTRGVTITTSTGAQVPIDGGNERVI